MFNASENYICECNNIAIKFKQSKISAGCNHVNNFRNIRKLT